MASLPLQRPCMHLKSILGLPPQSPPTFLCLANLLSVFVFISFHSTHCSNYITNGNTLKLHKHLVRWVLLLLSFYSPKRWSTGRFRNMVSVTQPVSLLIRLHSPVEAKCLSGLPDGVGGILLQENQPRSPFDGIRAEWKHQEECLRTNADRLWEVFM